VCQCNVPCLPKLDSMVLRLLTSAIVLIPALPPAQVKDCTAAGGTGAAAAQEKPHQVRGSKWGRWTSLGGIAFCLLTGPNYLSCAPALNTPSLPACPLPANRYIPNVAAALFAVLETVAEQREDGNAGGWIGATCLLLSGVQDELVCVDRGAVMVHDSNCARIVACRGC